MIRFFQIVWLRSGIFLFLPLLFIWLEPAMAKAGSDADTEGTVTSIQPIADDGLELKLLAGTNSYLVDILNVKGNSPSLYSRVRVIDGTRIIDEDGVPRTILSGLDKIECLSGSVIPMAETVAELRSLGSIRQHVECVTCLKGLVLAASSGSGTFALQDGTGVELVEIKKPCSFVAPGQEINLEGNCIAEWDHVLISSFPVVNNDGAHLMREQSGAIFLTAGKHPLKLSWFNSIVPFGLEVYYQGPGLPRQRIPDSALFHRETSSAGGIQWIQGLNYRCYEGPWSYVPDFDDLVPVKQGFVANFDPNVITRSNFVGLQFSGYVDVPSEGMYTFSTVSDDGSLMYIGEEPPSIEGLGAGALPAPVPVTVRQNLRTEQDDRWSQVEGTVTYVGEQAGGLELELSSTTGRMRVEVADYSDDLPQLLLNSRVRATGICLTTVTSDGQSVAGTLAAPGMDQVELQEVPAEQWNSRPAIPIGSLGGIELSTNTQTIVHVRGKIHAQPDGKLFIEDKTGFVPLEMGRSVEPDGESSVEMLGYWCRSNTNFVLRCAVCKVAGTEPPEGSKALPLLSTVEQVKRLNNQQGKLGYPVKIRGVVTTILDSGFFIQDSSGATYARWYPATVSDEPRIGDYWEVVGTTSAQFSPYIQVNSVTRLGMAALPEPIRPTWDQLINGSLDTEYIEIQGVVTAVESDGLTLLTRAGKITIQLPDQPQALDRYQDALVRIRGCVYPARDEHTQQVEIGQMTLFNSSIDVDDPAPGNPFSAPIKHASDLLLFDPHASALQRVKIQGQIVQERDGEYFLMDGQDGLRFVPKINAVLSAGDLVEVVGFPELGGPSPVLREALVHRIGQATLPAPQNLSYDALFDPHYDSTRVRIRARLMGMTRDASGQVFDLKAGTWNFVARLWAKDGFIPNLSQGSLLEVTGVYDGQGGDPASGRESNAFELLLNSGADIDLLERPSWWTLRHALTVMGGMGLAIVAAMVWITLLRRQVEERSALLVTEVRRREQVERQSDLDKERARIARDLHDELGSELTAIGMLATPGRKIGPETAVGRLQEIADKSRSLISALDGVVWVTNPRNDTLSSLVEYLASYAEEFLAKAETACRIEMPALDSGRIVAAEVRHDMLLAVREALNNAVRHGHPSEVLLRFAVSDDHLEILIKDNGKGFNTENDSQGNGLVNLHERMRNSGGRCQVDSSPDEGTSVVLGLPLLRSIPTKPKIR